MASSVASSVASSAPFFARLAFVLFVDSALLWVGLDLVPALLPLGALVLFVTFAAAS